MILLAAIAPAAAIAQGPDTLTPDGPATLYSDWHGAQTDEGLSPAVLTAFTVTVAPGGRAGIVRLRVHDREGTVREAAPVTLPAEPGTYTFPAPHIPYDYRDVTLGLDQETGRPRDRGPDRLAPADADFCASQSVDVYRPVLGDGVMPDRRLAETLRGRKLTIDAVSEPDNDGDLAGDETETAPTCARRWPSSGSAVAGARDDHRRQRRATCRRPTAAGDPDVSAGRPRALGAAFLAATTFARAGEDEGSQICGLEPLAPAGRGVSYVVPDPGRIELYGSAKAEGRISRAATSSSTWSGAGRARRRDRGRRDADHRPRPVPARPLRPRRSGAGAPDDAGAHLVRPHRRIFFEHDYAR